MTTALLATTYFGPVQWYQKLRRYGLVMMERWETFPKQTFRNRCLIATTQGVQALTVPVAASPTGTGLSATGAAMSPTDTGLSSTRTGLSPADARLLPPTVTGGVRLSEHGRWRHLHWQAITTAYGDSPFFEYYADELRPLIMERHCETLWELNWAIMLKMCDFIDIQPHLAVTTEWQESGDFTDFRTAIQPKHPAADADFTARPYYQVFSQKHGFLPNLSILDLLCNMGPESIFFL